MGACVKRTVVFGCVFVGMVHMWCVQNLLSPNVLRPTTKRAEPCRPVSCSMHSHARQSTIPAHPPLGSPTTRFKGMVWTTLPPVASVRAFMPFQTSSG